MLLNKIADKLTVLVERYPGVASIPSIMALLLFAIALFSFGIRGRRTFRPKRYSRLLTICLKSGCYLMIFCCLWGCFLLGSQTSLAKQHPPLSPVLEAAVGLSWLMIVVSCLLAEPLKKPTKVE